LSQLKQIANKTNRLSYASVLIAYALSIKENIDPEYLILEFSKVFSKEEVNDMYLSFADRLVVETRAPLETNLSKVKAELEAVKAAKAEAEKAAKAEAEKAAKAAKAEAKRHIENIIFLLQNKFKKIPPYVQKKVKSVTHIDVLLKVYKIAVSSQNITDFWEEIAQF
jgi:hypothetical protein